MDQCSHELTIDNICISCGYTLPDRLISYVTHIEPIKNGKLNYKYSLPDNDYFITQCILEILPNTCYLEEIKQIVRTKKFKKRTSTIDKIISASYFILKKNDDDVLKVDFVKYCKKGYYHFIKLVCDEFGFIANTEKYIWNVITRVYCFLEFRDFTFDKERVFAEVCGYENIECASVIDVVLYFVFKDDLIDSFEFYDLNCLTYISSLKRIIKQFTPEKEKKVSNNGLIKRINKVLEHMKDRNTQVRMDNIDLYLEKRILDGEDVNKLKKMTMKELKKEMNKTDEPFVY